MIALSRWHFTYNKKFVQYWTILSVMMGHGEELWKKKKLREPMISDLKIRSLATLINNLLQTAVYYLKQKSFLNWYNLITTAQFKRILTLKSFLLSLLLLSYSFPSVFLHIWSIRSSVWVAYHLNLGRFGGPLGCRRTSRIEWA